MPDKIVTLAMFHDPMAAEMTRNRLAAEGIPAMITGDNAGTLFGGMGGAFGMVHLQVAEEHLERATRLVDAWEEKDEEEPEDSTAITGTKPYSGLNEPRTGNTETEIATKPMPAPLEEEEDEPAIRVGSDELAGRAWKASIIGLLLMPFHFGVFLAVPVLLYAVVLLFRLMGMAEDLSARGTRCLYVGLLASTAAWALFFLIFMGFRLF